MIGQLGTSDLSGAVAIVTGGNSGIGKAIALALAAQNAEVVIDYLLDPAATEALEAQIVGLKHVDMPTLEEIGRRRLHLWIVVVVFVLVVSLVPMFYYVRSVSGTEGVAT